MTTLSVPARAHLNRDRSPFWRAVAIFLGWKRCENIYYREIRGKYFVTYGGVAYP